MQINRLFEMVYLLLHKKGVTAKELAAHFEVSQRTIYRDVETLSSAGIPIYTNKGKGGGIRLLDSFVLSKSVLSGEEQNDILSALHGLKAANYPDVDHVLTKLSALFGTADLNWIEIDFADWSNTQQEKFTLIKTAITHGRLLAFDYYSSYGERTSRLVEPVLLRFKERTWYLHAFCREKQQIRTFKLTRMKQLLLSDETFDRSKHSVTIDRDDIRPSIQPVTITLKVDASQAYRIYDDFSEEQVTMNEDGSYVATITYPEDEWVYGYLLSFGAYAEVLEPPHIRQIVKDRLQKTLDIYL